MQARQYVGPTLSPTLISFESRTASALRLLVLLEPSVSQRPMLCGYQTFGECSLATR